MTDTNPRDLIRRLTEKLDHLHCYYNVPDQSALIAEARDYLDQSVPEELTDEELREMWLGKKWFNEGATYREFASICRAALARWGK